MAGWSSACCRCFCHHHCHLPSTWQEPAVWELRTTCWDSLVFLPLLASLSVCSFLYVAVGVRGHGEHTTAPHPCPSCALLAETCVAIWKPPRPPGMEPPLALNVPTFAVPHLQWCFLGSLSFSYVFICKVLYIS